MKTRILILVDLDLVRKFQKISNNRLLFFQHLIKNHPEIKLIGPQDLPNPNITLHQLLQHCQIRPNIIFHYLLGPGAGPVADQIIVKGLNQTPIMTTLWLEDLQHIDKISPLIKNLRFKGLLMSVRQKSIVKQYLQLFPYLIIGSLDHYIDDSTFKDYKLQKKYDIIFYGFINHQYPFRARLFKLLNANRNRFRFKHIPHPGYWNIENKNTVTGQSLAKLLNQSHLAICTKSRHDMLVKKYLEAAFCNCGVVGDIPSDYRSQLKDKMIEINENMSDQQILQRIMLNLKNKEKLARTTQKLKNYLTTRYNYSAGGRYFTTISQQMWYVYYQRISKQKLPSSK